MNVIKLNNGNGNQSLETETYLQSYEMHTRKHWKESQT